MATHFCLVRHAAYSLLGHSLGGRSDHSLSEEGTAQAQLLADAFQHEPLVALVTSPVRRAMETAAPIGTRLGLPVQIEPDFTEIDFAAWTGAHFDALQGDPAWCAWNRFRSTAPVPGGETMLAVQARTLRGLTRLAQLYPEGRVAIITHADVIKAALAHCLGSPLDLLHRIEIGPASTSEVVLYGDDARILSVNGPCPGQR